MTERHRLPVVRAGLRVATLAVAAGLPGVLLVGTAVAAPATTASPAVAAAPRPGGQSAGDSLFPAIGNTGYDVGRYRISLDYRADRSITATTTVRARATRRLSSYSFDLEGLTVDRVRVDGHPAAFARHADKLVVTPSRPVRGTFTTVVRYHGTPVTHVDPDGSSEGWVRSATGATALGEPLGAQTWFPNNNTPRDKASFEVSVSAPKALAVAGNGVLTSRRRHGARTTWSWRQRQPMATYLAMVSIGKYDVYHSTLRLRSGRRIPVWKLIDPSLGAQRAARDRIKPIVAFSERQYGPYPFDSVGIVIQDLKVGYALETQTRPFFDGSADETTMVHELAHQWFGDSITPRDWGDLWLNEGLATYAEARWAAAHGGPTVAQAFAKVYTEAPASDGLWRPAPADLKDPAELFGDQVYSRGALTLEALQQRIGDRTMAMLLRRWTAGHRGGVVSTADFVALAERVSGANLGPFFHTWLYVPDKPTGF